MDVVALDIADLRVEVEEGADLHGFPEPDVVHADADRPLTPVDQRVGEAQLVGLAPVLGIRDILVLI